jgi:hypothetical protein
MDYEIDVSGTEEQAIERISDLVLDRWAARNMKAAVAPLVRALRAANERIASHEGRAFPILFNAELHDAIVEALGTKGEEAALQWLRKAFDKQAWSPLSVPLTKYAEGLEAVARQEGAGQLTKDRLRSAAVLVRLAIAGAELDPSEGPYETDHAYRPRQDAPCGWCGEPKDAHDPTLPPSERYEPAAAVGQAFRGVLADLRGREQRAAKQIAEAVENDESLDGYR